jgi:predicted small lipoprotein YifL
MDRQRRQRAVVFSVAAIAILSLAACGDAGPPAQLLPRDTVVPVSAVTKYFPDVTKESSTGPNETSVGKPIASRSVVFASADGKKKVTLSVDQYASASGAAAAFQTAVQGSKAAPGFNPAAAPDLGQEAFAGTSQVGAEMHFGLGARDGALIMSATHAGDIPVTPDNSNNLIILGSEELTTAKQILGPSGSD